MMVEEGITLQQLTSYGAVAAERLATRSRQSKRSFLENEFQRCSHWICLPTHCRRSNEYGGRINRIPRGRMEFCTMMAETLLRYLGLGPPNHLL